MDDYLKSESFFNWVHDDITWCGNECSNTKCYRNLVNRYSHDGMYSAAMFKGTEMCPLTWEDEDEKE